MQLHFHIHFSKFWTNHHCLLFLIFCHLMINLLDSQCINPLIASSTPIHMTQIFCKFQRSRLFITCQGFDWIKLSILLMRYLAQFDKDQTSKQFVKKLIRNPFAYMLTFIKDVGSLFVCILLTNWNNWSILCNLADKEQLYTYPLEPHLTTISAIRTTAKLQVTAVYAFQCLNASERFDNDIGCKKPCNNCNCACKHLKEKI